MWMSDRDRPLTLKWPDRFGPGWGTVGAVLLLALASLAASLVSLERLKNAALAAFDAGRPVGLPLLWASMGPGDAMLAALCAAALIFLVYLEMSRRVFSRFLVSANAAQSFAILTIIVAWLGQAYLFPGVLLGGDSGTHVARFLEVRAGLEAGSLPQWTNFDYLGSPLLGFTGPLLYVVGGALDLLVRDPVATAKILLFATHLAAGWAFYALLLRLGIARNAALLAAVGFAGSFAALHLFLYRGVFPQALTILFLVLIFYAAEGIMRAGAKLWRDWLIFALSVGGMIVNHQPHALFAALYLGLYGGAESGAGAVELETSLGVARRGDRWRRHFPGGGRAGHRRIQLGDDRSGGRAVSISRADLAAIVRSRHLARYADDMGHRLLGLSRDRPGRIGGRRLVCGLARPARS